MRILLVLTHRYIGLATAIFLALAGLTGSILAFQHEIDEALNPTFYEAPGQGLPLDLATLAVRAGADHPALDILYIESEGEPGHAALAVGLARPDPETGSVPDIDDWVYLDPVTGETLGTRTWGDCCFEAKNLIPFLYEFHHTLALPGNWGLYLMGGVAILWTLDCLVALVLTFPRGRPFFRKWKTAWTVKRGGGYRLALDLHRAGGLWAWMILLPIAISSIAMNLPEEVFKPAVSLFSPVPPNVWYERGALPPEELGEPALDYPQMLALGEAEGERRALPEPPMAIYFSADRNYFAVGYGDHDAPLGQPWLFFEGTEGRFLQAMIPGEGTAGEIFTTLQGPIHGGHILGLPGRILIAVLGLVICGLSITGVIIWGRKRAARLAQTRKGRAMASPPKAVEAG
ncbi:MAG: PepSY domain-containing protein [Rhodospirillum sp.]|nr:PepSY domain-containing protein [Rhodospirillum sp.]MCF8488993.1 PepSY domain-containing protein [Rhodospirillum sp.]MCF8502056.1 PepSY domain-containing protein [Rhodospirillum sp.]